jgi:hypothetical protein
MKNILLVKIKKNIKILKNRHNERYHIKMLGRKFNNMKYRYVFSIDFIMYWIFFYNKKIKPTNRNPRIIVSLTSIPTRFNTLHLVIRSILNQSTLPDKIVLWLSPEYKKFGSCSLENLPKSLLKLQKRGLEIYWTKDIGSYRKLLPSLKKFPQDIIITIDDDIFYFRHTIKPLYDAYLKHGKNSVYCRESICVKKTKEGKILRKGYNYSDKNNHKVLCFSGGNGVLYPKDVMPKEIFNESVREKLAGYEDDDAWFNVMVLLNKKKIFQVNSTGIMFLPSYKNDALHAIYTPKKSDARYNALLDYYKLKNSSIFK